MLPPTPSSLTGQLFTYGSNRVAFESLFSFIPSPQQQQSCSPPQLPPNKCILLGGLSDGLIPVPYTHILSEMVCQFPHPLESFSRDNSETERLPPASAPHPQEQTWSLVQPILSSSYTGFGHGTLDRDVMELQELIEYLHQYRNATQNIMLIGHSTGCQQIVHYFQKYHPMNSHVTAAVLQAPVSDREAAMIWHPNESLCSTEQEHDEQLQAHIALAKDMKEIQNRGHEMMPRRAFWAPITAHRYYDLMVKGSGLDDYFSSDYTNDELQARLSHMSLSSSSSTSVLRRVIVAYSGQDEYVPKHLDTKVLLQRLCHAMNNRNYDDVCADSGGECDDEIVIEAGSTQQYIAQPLYLPHGNHNLSSNNGSDAQTLMQRIYKVMMELTA